MWGTSHQIAMAALAIDITLQQRNGGRIVMDFDDLSERDDVVTTEVPVEAVGFVLGGKGATLRALETKFKTFMFFDNEKKRENCKRLYIVATTRDSREGALKEVEEVVRFKITGESTRGGPGGPGGGRYRGGGGYRDRSPPRRGYSRSPPRRDRHDDRGRYDDRAPRREEPRRDYRDEPRREEPRRDERRDERRY